MASRRPSQASHPSHVVEGTHSVFLRAFTAFTGNEIHAVEAHDARPHLPLEVIVAHVRGRSRHPGTAALSVYAS